MTKEATNGRVAQQEQPRRVTHADIAAARMNNLDMLVRSLQQSVTEQLGIIAAYEDIIRQERQLLQLTRDSLTAKIVELQDTIQQLEGKITEIQSRSTCQPAEVQSRE